MIVVGPGVVPAQQETPDGGTKTLTFTGEPGNKICQLINHAANVTFDGLDIDAERRHADRGGVRDRTPRT